DLAAADGARGDGLPARVVRPAPAPRGDAGPGHLLLRTRFRAPAGRPRPQWAAVRLPVPRRRAGSPLAEPGSVPEGVGDRTRTLIACATPESRGLGATLVQVRRSQRLREPSLHRQQSLTVGRP